MFLACVTLCFYYTAKLYLGIDFIKLQNFYEGIIKFTGKSQGERIVLKVSSSVFILKNKTI